MQPFGGYRPLKAANGAPASAYDLGDLHAPPGLLQSGTRVMYASRPAT